MRVDWSGEIPGDLIHLELRGSHIYLEGGRPDWPGRGHEGYGGTYTIEEIRRDPVRFLGQFPGLYDEVMSDLSETHWADAVSELLAWKYPQTKSVTHSSILCVDVVEWQTG